MAIKDFICYGCERIWKQWHVGTTNTFERDGLYCRGDVQDAEDENQLAARNKKYCPSISYMYGNTKKPFPMRRGASGSEGMAIGYGRNGYIKESRRNSYGIHTP